MLFWLYAFYIRLNPMNVTVQTPATLIKYYFYLILYEFDLAFCFYPSAQDMAHADGQNKEKAS